MPASNPARPGYKRTVSFLQEATSELGGQAFCPFFVDFLNWQSSSFRSKVSSGDSPSTLQRKSGSHKAQTRGVKTRRSAWNICIEVISTIREMHLRILFEFLPWEPSNI